MAVDAEYVRKRIIYLKDHLKKGTLPRLRKNLVSA